MCAKGKGRDWLYAGWFFEMLGIAEQGVLPVAYAEYEEASDGSWATVRMDGSSEVRVPAPPVAETNSEVR